jgi:hypothetical protein
MAKVLPPRVRYDIDQAPERVPAVLIARLAAEWRSVLG